MSDSFYDLLGILSQVIIQSKIIFQLLCKEKIDWDSCLPEVIIKIWQEFINTSRYIFGEFNSNYETLQFHGFCDSSQKPSIYLRLKLTLPVKKLTIPRIELLSCLLLAKLMSTVLNALKCKYSEATLDCLIQKLPYAG